MIPEYVLQTDSPGTALSQLLTDGPYSSIGILVDENTLINCYPVVQSYLPSHTVIEINSGEPAKNIQTCQYIWEKLTQAGFDRSSLLINLGGGVIGDMGGFCAASFKRGIDFINIPTTLLSMVDASIGGKLGIDFNGFKNHIGFFKTPEKVLISSRFLSTLPADQFLSGYAEVIKHALIRDAEQFDKLGVLDLDSEDWDRTIKYSLAIKGKIVSDDPYETGLRKILNFGHSVGHAIESYFLSTSKPLLHGEAIAIGMICESWLSMEINLLSKLDLEYITEKLIKIFGKKDLIELDQSKIVELLYQDKKNKGNTILMSLLKQPGLANYDVEVKEEEVIKSIGYYLSI